VRQCRRLGLCARQAPPQLGDLALACGCCGRRRIGALAQRVGRARRVAHAPLGRRCAALEPVRRRRGLRTLGKGRLGVLPKGVLALPRVRLSAGQQASQHIVHMREEKSVQLACCHWICTGPNAAQVRHQNVHMSQCKCPPCRLPAGGPPEPHPSTAACAMRSLASSAAFASAAAPGAGVSAAGGLAAADSAGPAGPLSSATAGSISVEAMAAPGARARAAAASGPTPGAAAAGAGAGADSADAACAAALSPGVDGALGTLAAAPPLLAAARPRGAPAAPGGPPEGSSGSAAAACRRAQPSASSSSSLATANHRL